LGQLNQRLLNSERCVRRGIFEGEAIMIWIVLVIAGLSLIANIVLLTELSGMRVLLHSMREDLASKSDNILAAVRGY